MESYGQRPMCAAWLHQHCGCLALRQPPGSPVTAGHTSNPLWAPVVGESPPVPRQEAELGGCHQVSLPGPDLDRGFLCGGNREMSVMQRRYHRRKLPEKDNRRQRARSQGFAFWEELGQLLGMASYRHQAGQQHQGRRTGAQEGTAGRSSPPHAHREGPGCQGAVQERAEMRHCDRRVRAGRAFLKAS